MKEPLPRYNPDTTSCSYLFILLSPLSIFSLPWAQERTLQISHLWGVCSWLRSLYLVCTHQQWTPPTACLLLGLTSAQYHRGCLFSRFGDDVLWYIRTCNTMLTSAIFVIISILSYDILITKASMGMILLCFLTKVKNQYATTFLPDSPCFVEEVVCFQIISKLGFVEGDFLLCTMVHHRQTTIWENMFYSFQAFYANPRKRSQHLWKSSHVFVIGR